MSAILCGKRSFFEDIDSAASSPASASPPAYKKFRCSSPVRFACSPPIHPSAVDQLRALFPDMEIKLLEKVLEDSGNDLEAAINNLNELHLGDLKYSSGLTGEENPNMAKVPLQEAQPQNNLPEDGAEWVDLFVKEMMAAANIDDARARAARILENLEKSISARAFVAAEGIHKENIMLKEQMEALLRDNAILKRAVAIQHERHKEFDDKNQEVLQLKQVLAQYQEQLRTLEANNYALTLRLQQSQMNNTIPGRYYPDVF